MTNRNRYYLEDRDYIDGADVDARKQKNKHKEKRVERALKTKDISALLEDEESDYAYDSIYDEMADEDSWPDDREEYR
jgi:hypothetical protein